MTIQRKAGENEPTEGQKKAGNYFKAHKALHGMRISIENEAGTKRRGVAPDGTPWESEMAHDYGYIRGTTGKDKDHLDVFMGPEAEIPGHKVYIVDQNDDNGDFDEHKILMGFPSASAAYSAYHKNYPAGHDKFHDITETDMDTFKRWAFSGKGAKTKRASEMRYFDAEPGVETKDFAKGGTVTGEETVGLGTFGGGDQQNLVGQAPPATFGAGVGAGSGSGGAPATSFGGVNFVGGQAQPVTNSGEPSYSSAGLSRNLSQPYNQSAGIVRPTAELGNNPGSVDPLLSSQLQMGGRGNYQRGATAFLGAGFNPWTQEYVGDNGGSGLVAPANQDANLDNLFALASSLGIDTGGYSHNVGNIGIRGERSNDHDATALYDRVNDAAKNYVSVDHMTPDGRGMERTMYMEDNGRLNPISQPTRRSSRQDNTFFGNDFKEMLMTIGPALLGGFGGWAGLLGQAGTTAAPYINAAGNAVVGGATGGTRGALASAFGSAGGAAGSAVGNAAGGYGGIGGQIGSRLASEAYRRSST